VSSATINMGMQLFLACVDFDSFTKKLHIFTEGRILNEKLQEIFLSGKLVPLKFMVDPI
jgi:hypothetical protein